jgi:hypothetical protein
MPDRSNCIVLVSVIFYAAAPKAASQSPLYGLRWEWVQASSGIGAVKALVSCRVPRWSAVVSRAGLL